MDILQHFSFLYDGLFFLFSAEGWKNLVMILVGGLLIWLALKKDFEPALLMPMGIGAILVNLFDSGAVGTAADGSTGIIEWLFKVGIEASEAMPLLLFIGIGAMIDFGPLLSNPKMFLFGAAAQFGIFLTVLVASFMFPFQDAAAIGVIGAADGPTSILVSQMFKSAYVGQIAVAAYSYMALVPIIQPAAIKAVTTKKERMIRMPYNPQSVSRRTRILFPLAVMIVAGLVAPKSVSLVGMLMFGNLLRECLKLDSLSQTAQTTLANLITFLPEGKKINPMVGGAGISAFPMSARVIQKMALKEDNQNHLLMHAVGANVAGQIGSVVAGGIILTVVPRLMGA